MSLNAHQVSGRGASFTSNDPTGYLQEKKLHFELLSSLIGLRRIQDWWYGDCLEYPLINVKGQVTGCERIYPRGLLHQKCPDRFAPKDNKKVTKGTKVSESFALIGMSISELPHYFGCLRVVGGMADAVNVYLATGEPVVCIVGENNASSIVQQLTQEWPHLASKIIVALDHDLAGIMACHRTGCLWVVPERFGEDWSDVLEDVGFQGIKRQLQQVRNPVQPVDIKSIPHEARTMAADKLGNDFQKSLKLLTSVTTGQAAAILASAIVQRFNHQVPAKCDEHSFLQRIQMANPYWLHLDTLWSLRKQLGGYCRERQQTVQRLTGLSQQRKQSLGSHYHCVDIINAKTVPLEKDKITLIKAPYASGKTRLLSALSLAAMQGNQRIMAGTHLVSLAHELQNRLALESYLDIPESFMSGIDRLVTCINSLCAPNVERFLASGALDILVLDEFTQHISSLGTSPYIKDPKILQTYLDLIEKTPTVVICDADLSSHHVSLLQEWFPDRDICFYEMPFTQDEAFDCHFSVGKANASAVVEHELLPAIAQGEKVAIASDNRTYAEKLEGIIRKQFPDINLLMIDGSNRNERAQRAFLKNSSEEAERYQVVIYTPAIQSGLSITAEFQQVFGFSHNIVLPTDFVQMLRRFRTVRQFTVVADIETRFGGNTDPLSRIKALEHTSRYTVYRENIRVSDYDFFCESEKARQIELRNLGGNGLHILMESRGFTMHYSNPVPASESFGEQWQTMSAEIQQREIEGILKAPIISGTQYEELAHKAEPRKQELYSCRRFKICDELGIVPTELTETDISFWLNTGLTRLRRFMQYPRSDGNQYQTKPDADNLPLCHRRFEDIAVKVYQDLLLSLFPNWDYTQSWGEHEAEQVIDKVEAWHNDAPFMLNQLKLIPDSVIKNTKQGAQFHRPKYACNFVNNMLRMAGLTIEKQQIRTGIFDPETGKEKRERKYSINPQSLTMMQHYASTRAVHKQIGVSHTGGYKLQIPECVTIPEPSHSTDSKSKVPENQGLDMTMLMKKSVFNNREPEVEFKRT